MGTGKESSRVRKAREQLARLLRDEPSWLEGSLVTMARTCGRAGCRCERGEKHVSLYLAVRHGNKRKMIYIPQALEEKVRAQVGVTRSIERCLGEISRASLERLLEEKAHQ